MNIFQFKKDERGSFTIEATIVFPVIFITTIIFIFFSLYMYQKVTLYYVATQAAERAAFVWDNSHKDPITGVLADPTAHDGIYWRLFNDNITNVVTSHFGAPLTVTFEAANKGSVSAGGSLPQKKLGKIAQTIPSGISGDIVFDNQFISREVTVTLNKPIRAPSFVLKALGTEEVRVSANAKIIEPAQYVRNVDYTVNYFYPKLAGDKGLIKKYLKYLEIFNKK